MRVAKESHHTKQRYRTASERKMKTREDGFCESTSFPRCVAADRSIFRLERGKIPGAMGPLPMKTAFALLTATSLSIQLHAQSSAPAPARTNAPSRRDAPALVSPEAETDGAVTFRPRAPDVRGGKVSGE